ncbi:hypothetical protein ACFRMO_08265 [Streptomyces anulatus]|uniref:hypothetical protein n=1 Tax=Streptomyces anulatus TaxID=1892 RepID=UPI0036832BD1
MKCTSTTWDGASLIECGHESFDLTLPAMLSLDLSGEPEAHRIEVDGFQDDTAFSLTCKSCSAQVENTVETDKTITRLVIKLHKQLGAKLLFSTYTFEDGTTINPEDITA